MKELKKYYFDEFSYQGRRPRQVETSIKTFVYSLAMGIIVAVVMAVKYCFFS